MLDEAVAFETARAAAASDVEVVPEVEEGTGTEDADEEVVMVGGIELDGGGGCTAEAGREVDESVEGEELRASRLLVCR